MTIRMKDIFDSLANSPGLLQELAREYNASKFEPRHRRAALHARALALVTKEQNRYSPPYPARSDERRHWVDGWNWGLRGISRAEATEAFWEGKAALEQAREKGLTVTLREDY